MQKKLYATGHKFHPEKISVWKVEKETEKTFVVREYMDEEKELTYGPQWTIKKNQMTGFGGIYCLSLDEAIKIREEKLNQLIKLAENQIKTIETQKKAIEETLAKLKGEKKDER